MPGAARPIDIAAKPECNCELCSASLSKKPIPLPQPARPAPWRRQEKIDDIPCIKLKNPPRRPLHISSRTLSKFHTGCAPPSGRPSRDRCKPVDDVEDDAPCRPRKNNIIRRNKLAVKILSRQMKAEKLVAPPCDPRYDKLKLFPTARHAMHWAPAYSLARSSQTFQPCGKKRKKAPVPCPKPRTPAEILADETTACSCELMARAVRHNLHHHFGLTDQRDKINAGIESPPPIIQSTTNFR